MGKFSIGVDYGTLSARGLLLDLENGNEVAVSEFVYPHKVMGKDEFSQFSIDSNSALQDPKDYLDALKFVVKDIIEKSGVSTVDIAGICFDFTSCTVLPVDGDGTPLCFLDKYKDNPHAYAKLWKHHSAENEANEITLLAQKYKPELLKKYGNKISSEWLFPKMLEVLRKAPDVFEDTVRFIEAADWLVWKITGNEVHSSCMAGYKALWSKANGYPENAFWSRIDSKLGDIIGTKVSENVLPTGSKAGEISIVGAELTGLDVGTTVAVPVIDAHASLPAAGIVDEGKLMIIVGTSACHIVMSKTDKVVEGICGSVSDGIVPGYVAYEAGQACVGDSFDWFVKNCVPYEYVKEAEKLDLNIFKYMEQKAEKLKIGESGVLVLDWWNGNRSPYSNYDLSGAIIGLTLKTKPEDIYRGILESTAFGTKTIVDLYEKNDIAINEIYVAGGIPQKSPLLMQIYADVLGKPLKVTNSSQSGAKGSALFASVAGGYFKSIKDASKVISDECEKTYFPDFENTQKYNILYKEYMKLSEYFSSSQNDIMKKLRNFPRK